MHEIIYQNNFIWKWLMSFCQLLCCTNVNYTEQNIFGASVWKCHIFFGMRLFQTVLLTLYGSNKMTRITLEQLLRRLINKLYSNTLKSIKHQNCVPTLNDNNKEFFHKQTYHSTIVCNKKKINKVTDFVYNVCYTAGTTELTELLISDIMVGKRKTRKNEKCCFCIIFVCGAISFKQHFSPGNCERMFGDSFFKL